LDERLIWPSHQCRELLVFVRGGGSTPDRTNATDLNVTVAVNEKVDVPIGLS